MLYLNSPNKPLKNIINALPSRLWKKFASSTVGVMGATISLGNRIRLGGGCEREHPGDPVPASVLHPAHSADGPHPAEAFLEALTDPVTEVTRGRLGATPVERGATF